MVHAPTFSTVRRWLLILMAVVLVFALTVVPSIRRSAAADTLPTVQFIKAAPSVLEGAAGTKSRLEFTVVLSAVAVATAPVTVSYATSDGTAVAPGDYKAKTASKTISAGKRSMVFSVVVKGDDIPEADETTFVTLTGAVGATLGRRTETVGTILNDDEPAPGRVIAWGYNVDGETTVPVDAQSGVTAIAAGGFHSLALKNGRVIAWGDKSSGQSTVPVGAQSGVTAIAAGEYHSLALKNGQVIAWGDNNAGQTEVPVDAQSGVTAIAAGDFFSLALKNSGVIAWGDTVDGETTVPVDAQSGVTAIAGGSFFSLALKNGGVIAWGDDDAGQTDVPVGAQSGVTIIAAGLYHSLALKNGGVIAWGDNVDGETTVPVDAQSGVTAIAAGRDHSLALKQ